MSIQCQKLRSKVKESFVIFSSHISGSLSGITLNTVRMQRKWTDFFYTLKSRIIGKVGIIEGSDIVIIINNRGVGIMGLGGWTRLKK